MASPQQPYFNPLVPSNNPTSLSLAKLSSIALVAKGGRWEDRFSLSLSGCLFFIMLFLSFLSPLTLYLCFPFTSALFALTPFASSFRGKIGEHKCTADASCLEQCLGLMQCVMCINSLHPPTHSLHHQPPSTLSFPLSSVLICHCVTLPTGCFFTYKFIFTKLFFFFVTKFRLQVCFSGCNEVEFLASVQGN